MIKRSLVLLSCMIGLSFVLCQKNSCFATENDWLFENNGFESSDGETDSTCASLIKLNTNENEKKAKINKFKQYVSEFYKKKFGGESITPKIKDVAEKLYLKLKKFVEKTDNIYDHHAESFDDKINNFLFENKSVKVIKFEKNFNQLKGDIKKLHASFKNSEPFNKFIENDFSCTKFETPFGHGIYATDDEGVALNFAINDNNNLKIDQKNFDNYNSYEKSEKPFNGIVSVAFDPKNTKVINYQNLQKIKLAMLFLHPDMFNAYEIFDGRYGFDAKNCDFSKFYSKKEKLKSLAFSKVFNITLESAMSAIDPDHKLSDAEYDRECCELLIKAFKNQNFFEKFNETLENDLSDETYTNHMFAAFNNTGLLTKLLEADAAVVERNAFGRKICEYNFVNPEVLIVCGNEQNRNNEQMTSEIITSKCENNQRKIDDLLVSLSGTDKQKQASQNKSKNSFNFSFLLEDKPKNTDELGEILQTKLKKKHNELDHVTNSINNIHIKQKRGLNQTLNNLENHYYQPSSSNYYGSLYGYPYEYNDYGNRFEIFPSYDHTSFGLSDYF